MNNNEKLDQTAGNTQKATGTAPEPAAKHLQAFLKSIIDNKQPPAISTGFPILDDTLGGGVYAGLYFLGAVSSLGKTTFVGQIADQMAIAGQDVLFFTLEMSYRELMARSMSRLSAIISPDGFVTTRGLLNSVSGGRDLKTKQLIEQSASVYEGIANHVYFHEGLNNIDIDYVRDELKNFIDTTGKKPVVIIDYIQILTPSGGKNLTDKQNIDQIVVELKRMSRDHDIVIIGISSVNRASYKEGMNMSSYKESGSIEYSADVLLGLQLKGADQSGFDPDVAKRKPTREVELKILKNRNGPVGETVGFTYKPAKNLFEEVYADRDGKQTSTVRSKINKTGTIENKKVLETYVRDTMKRLTDISANQETLFDQTNLNMNSGA